MLKFEFVQGGEFDNPKHDVIDDDGEWVGYIYYDGGGWLFTPSRKWGLYSGCLTTIASKLEELDKNTKSQRILGVF